MAKKWEREKFFKDRKDQFDWNSWDMTERTWEVEGIFLDLNSDDSDYFKVFQNHSFTSISLNMEDKK